MFHTVYVSRRDNQMDRRIKELVDRTQEKFGLGDYYLKRHSIDRDVNMFQETIYTLTMEWFPNHMTESEDDDLNPEGTAVVEMNINSKQYHHIIFVGEKTFADGVMFQNGIKDIVQWIEQETSFIYQEHFQLQTEEDGKLLFAATIDGIKVSPPGVIEVTWDHDGRLLTFAIYGEFPPQTMAKKEAYTLTLDQAESILKEQLQLVDFPLYEQEKLLPIYVVEDIFITNNKSETLPFEVFSSEKSFTTIDQTIEWEQPNNETFDRKDIDWTADVSVEEAFAHEPSLDSFSLTRDEEEKCVEAVKNCLCQEYKDESGQWILHTLHREKSYIHATLRKKKRTRHLFQRKLVIFIDPQTFTSINFIDNEPMLDMYDGYDRSSEEVTITKDQAYAKLFNNVQLEPYYVYNYEQETYVLCGKLECDQAVQALTGEIVDINDL